MMEKQRFLSMLFLLVPQIIQLMIDDSKIDEEKASFLATRHCTLPGRITSLEDIDLFLESHQHG